ncbi:MAG TPA: energy-coupling factor ABC transporter permease [Pirellulales bacterium]|nr:energy-coupling factor ABC transporter permease [Pirellulales bacterium]
MHLGNGAITPECGLYALGAAATSTAIALVVARSKPVGRHSAFGAAALGAAVFAAQMFNVQILPFSSAHLIGGVLLAWALGPPLGLLMMTAILALEAVMLGDGGLLALGANVINMGVVPAVFVAIARRFTRGGGPLRECMTLGAVSLLATIAAAGLVVVEVSIGRSAAQLEGLSQFTAQMLGSHAVFGVLEAVITVAIVAILGGMKRQEGVPVRFSPERTASIAAVAIAIAVLSAPQFGLASSAPDGYETAVAKAQDAGSPLGNLQSAATAGELNARVQAWQNGLVAAFPSSETVRGLLGTLSAGALAIGLAVACRKPKDRAAA